MKNLISLFLFYLSEFHTTKDHAQSSPHTLKLSFHHIWWYDEGTFLTQLSETLDPPRKWKDCSYQLWESPATISQHTTDRTMAGRPGSSPSNEWVLYSSSVTFPSCGSYWSLIVRVRALRGRKEVAGQMERILLEMCMVESVLIKGHKV